jgi:hypothetical protein
MENQVSIIINGVKYDKVEENGSSCRQCDLLKVCHDYRICRAFSFSGKIIFKKSDKKFEV